MNFWLNLLFSARCPLCDRPLGPKEAERAALCPDCVQRVRREWRADSGKPVAGCTQTDAALLYCGSVRELIVRMKYRRRQPLARRWLGRQTGARLLSHQPDWQVDLVTYVPTSLNHWWRRGFNLSAVLARETAQVCGLPCRRTLRRALFSRYQAEMPSAQARRDNVAHAFSPWPGVRLDGLRVALVDDVLSTGATAAACAACLRAMGAAEVYLVCAAKTPGKRSKIPKKG